MSFNLLTIFFFIKYITHFFKYIYFLMDIKTVYYLFSLILLNDLLSSMDHTILWIGLIVQPSTKAEEKIFSEYNFSLFITQNDFKIFCVT